MLGVDVWAGVGAGFKPAPTPTLLVPQCLYRLQIGGAFGGVDAEEQTYRRREQCRQQYGIQTNCRVELRFIGSGDGANQRRQAPAQRDADQSTEEA